MPAVVGEEGWTGEGMPCLAEARGSAEEEGVRTGERLSEAGDSGSSSSDSSCDRDCVMTRGVKFAREGEKEKQLSGKAGSQICELCRMRYVIGDAGSPGGARCVAAGGLDRTRAVSSPMEASDRASRDLRTGRAEQLRPGIGRRGDAARVTEETSETEEGVSIKYIGLPCDEIAPPAAAASVSSRARCGRSRRSQRLSLAAALSSTTSLQLNVSQCLCGHAAAGHPHRMSAVIRQIEGQVAAPRTINQRFPILALAPFPPRWRLACGNPEAHQLRLLFASAGRCAPHRCCKSALGWRRALAGSAGNPSEWWHCDFHLVTAVTTTNDTGTGRVLRTHVPPVALQCRISPQPVDMQFAKPMILPARALAHAGLE
ncbi:hypothetical protein FH972_025089 [Carpinus fangiana]|uniref:Uncharacterized protein n=1 Tax=Carpinus fangiana TaxID=176857 RepID=A0A5N6L058_9ROSI|nr:hypothetical protein FH972_025089 [Carpinus fangiana]